MRLILAMMLALAVVAGACGGDDDTAADDTSAADDGGAEPADDGGAEPADEGVETDDGGVEPADEGVETDDGGAEPADQVDVDAVCELNRELATTAESAFGGEDLDLESADAAVVEFSRLLEEMAASAPADLREDMLVYRDALVVSFELVSQHGFDPEAVPREEIDAYAQRFPDANLFGSSEIENGLREWFEANCPEPFAF